MTIFYSIEDVLSEAVAEKLIAEFCSPDIQIISLGKSHGGFGHIKNNMHKYRELANRAVVLVITDLDHAICPPSLRQSWLSAANINEPLPQNMLFCIAKTEIESWLLADHSNISSFLGISRSIIKNNIEESVVDAKEYLVNLAKRSSIRSIRENLAPRERSKAATGLNYNNKMREFAINNWHPRAAALESVSLERTIRKLSSLGL